MKGVPNKATREVKDFCFKLVSDPVYQRNFQTAFQTRRLVPQLEELVWHYAYGRPTQALDVNVNFDHESYLAGKTPADAK